MVYNQLMLLWQSMVIAIKRSNEEIVMYLLVAFGIREKIISSHFGPKQCDGCKNSCPVINNK